MGAMERKIFALYNNGVKINIDQKDFDNEWHRHDY
jgi:hypothetical protein